MMKGTGVILGISIGLTVGTLASAGNDLNAKGGAEMEMCRTGDGTREGMRVPKATESLTKHHFAAGGASFDYEVTVGTLVIHNDDDEPIASIGYIAYTRSDSKDTRRRPIMFAFDGGPGASSVMLHMGLLGPKRVLVEDPGTAVRPKPYEMVDNPFGMLDESDLVLIDPVGTGLSHGVCGHKDDEFWGVDADIDSVSRFIAEYIDQHNRWTSPKYLLGESYGTTRAAAVVDYLRARRSILFNGVVLVSMITDMELTFTELPGNTERPYPMLLPAYAAVAWYHHMVAGHPPALESFLDKVRRFAAGPYAAALFKGDSLPQEERDVVAEQIHRYTGLPAEFINQHDLRVSVSAFTHELFRSQQKIVSRLDGRILGPAPSTPLHNEFMDDNDPELQAVIGSYTAAFLDYYHRDLKFGAGQHYQVMNERIESRWRWSHRPIGDSGQAQPIVNSGVDLAHALVSEPNLGVLVLSGYFDLGAPFTAAEYMIAHLGVPPEVSSRIQIRYYKAGHMMYVDPLTLEKVKRDMDAFIDSTRQ
jgi:carboxypeptidase C (cathepsin A)